MPAETALGVPREVLAYCGERVAQGDAMSARVPTVVEVAISIDRQVRDGWYIYTSAQLPGLLVVSRNEQEAIADLPAVIEALIKADFGVAGRVVHKIAAQVEDMRTLATHAEAVEEAQLRALAAGDQGHLSYVVQCDPVLAAHAA